MAIAKKTWVGIFSIIVALFLFSLLLVIPSAPLLVYADNENIKEYSNVIDDLEKDSNFDLSDYPVNNEDYSLQLIQIAESVDNELFVYVYQPCADKEILATSINISQESRSLSFMNYDLVLLNSNGTLYKYKVEDFLVSDSLIRYYEISSIFRTFNAEIDETESGVVTEVPYSVSKAYSMTGHGEDLVIFSQDVETIEVTNKYVGFVRYEDGFKLFSGAGGCDSHFVAFSTDRQIDKLMEADVYYVSQSRVHREGYYNDTTFGTATENYAYLQYTDSASYEPDGWFVNHTYTWDRIQSINDFIAGENRENVFSCGALNVYTTSKITDQGLSDLQGMQWVLRFAETSYSSDFHDDGLGGITGSFPIAYTKTHDTVVSDVTILRLKFETVGKIYNLGVIDNKMNSSDEPINDTQTSLEIDWQKVLLYGVIAIVAVVMLAVLAPYLPTIFKYIFLGIWYLIKGIWWVLTLPYRIFTGDF